MNFYKVVIDERKRRASRTHLSEADRERLDKTLKVLANATSYGIYAEMHRLESDQKVRVICHGIDAEAFQPCAALTPTCPANTASRPWHLSLRARHASCCQCWSTQCERSAAHTQWRIPTRWQSSRLSAEGIIPCAGGRVGKRRNLITALSWEEVDRMSDRFAALNPYEKDAVPGSILKIEDDNRDPKTHEQRQLHCVAISAKRYALFVQDATRSEPSLLRRGVNNKEDRWSEHGLGHLLNPTDPDSEDRDWIARVWLDIIRRALGLPTKPPDFESLPALGRLTVSSPAVMRPLEKLNRGKIYGDQIKPFNFLLTCHVKALGHPIGSDPERFHLIAPYETDSRKWLKHGMD